MQRRKMLAALGSVAVGGATAVSTGAFTSVTADRSVSVSVAGDANAFLGLDQIEDEPNSQDYTSVDGGEFQLFGTEDVNGTGFNLDSVTLVDNLFKIKNQSSQTQFVYLEEIGSPDGPEGGSGFNSGTRPTGMFFVGFYSPGNRSGDWDGISYGSAPGDPNNPNERGPDQPNDKQPADAAPFNGDGQVVQPPGDRADAQKISPGGEITVGMAVDTTTTLTEDNFYDEDTKLGLGDLIDEVVVKARADEEDTPTTL